MDIFISIKNKYLELFSKLPKLNEKNIMQFSRNFYIFSVFAITFLTVGASLLDITFLLFGIIFFLMIGYIFHQFYINKESPKISYFFINLSLFNKLLVLYVMITVFIFIGLFIIFSFSKAEIISETTLNSIMPFYAFIIISSLIFVIFGSIINYSYKIYKIIQNKKNSNNFNLKETLDKAKNKINQINNLNKKNR